jgi:hypothetical protein
MSVMSFQETLTSLLNIVLLPTGNKATKAVVHHKNAKANFVRIGDTSGRYSNVSFTDKVVISIEDNLVTSVSHKRSLGSKTLTSASLIIRTLITIQYHFF